MSTSKHQLAVIPHSAPATKLSFPLKVLVEEPASNIGEPASSNTGEYVRYKRGSAMKLCSRCKQTKNKETDYHKGTGICKPCKLEYNAELRKKKLPQKEVIAKPGKRCTKCQEIKDEFIDFTSQTNTCKICKAKYDQQRNRSKKILKEVLETQNEKIERLTKCLEFMESFLRENQPLLYRAYMKKVLAEDI